MKLALVVAVVAFALRGANQPVGGAMSADSLVSPRIARLEAEVARRGPAAAEEFWREVTAGGAPLVESVADNPRERLVTFLWRAESPVRDVLVLGAAFGGEPRDKRLSPIGGSDVWFKTMLLPSDLRTQYRFSIDPPLPATGGPDHWRRDPFNARTFVYPRDPDDPAGSEVVRSLLELPDAPAQPLTAQRPSVPAGTLERHRFTSSTLGNTRRLFVYLPSGYSARASRYPLLIVFDGAAYLSLVPTPTILDNMIADRLIPPVVAVLVDNPDAATRNRELDCYPPFGRFLVTELLPWVRQRYRVTDRRDEVILAGSSGGAQASMCLAQQHPDHFGAVLAQSGSFFADPAKPIGNEWVYRHLVTGPRLPLRFYLDIGRFEPVPMVTAVRVMRNVLEAKGYHVAYQEFTGGHDYAWWRGTLSDGLIALLGRPSRPTARNR